jgi:hypothetical protein
MSNLETKQGGGLTILFLPFQFVLLGRSLSNARNLAANTRLHFEETDVGWESTCILTISAWNNFGFVKSFFKTAKETNPKLTCHVWFVADNPDPWNPETKELVENHLKPEIPEDWIVLTLNDIQPLVDYHLAELALRFDLVCFNTAVKPLAFKWIFSKTKADKVMYFDNDIWIMQPLTTIVGLLEKHSFVVTPHMVHPYEVDGKHQDERNIAQAGIMNFGFVGLSKSESTSTFLDWWAQRLRFYGYVDVANGMHFDQNWSDFIPIFWNNDEYYILREPEFNIAYWNMHYTADGITFDGSEVQLHGQPVVFIHFSGTSDYRTYNIEDISKHQNRFVMSSFGGQLRDVFEAYIEIIDGNNCLQWRGVPYGYETFENGMVVHDLMRKYYGKISYFANQNPDSVAFRNAVHGNPFCTTMDNPSCAHNAKTTTFWQWMLDSVHHFPVDLDAHFGVPQLIYQVYLLRADVMAAFPDPFGAGHQNLLTWAYGNGLREHGLEAVVEEDLRGAQSLLAKNPKRPWGLNLFGQFSTPFERGAIELMIHRCITTSSVPQTVVKMPDILLTNSLQPQTKTGGFDFQHDLDFTRMADNVLNIFILGPENLETFFETYPRNKFRSHYNLGIFLWDWSSVPASYSRVLAQFTEIWTLSDFTSSALQQSAEWSGNSITSMQFLSGKALAQILPEPSTAEKTEGVASLLERLHIPQDAFVFATILDSYCEDRDNLVGSVAAFFKAFPTDEDVHYIIVVNPSRKNSRSKMQLTELEDIVDGTRAIHLVAGEIPQATLTGLRQRIDCYVSLHASSGFIHEVHDTIVNGGIALTTDYGGHLDCIRTAPFGLSEILVGYKLATKTVQCDFMDGEAVVAEASLEDAASKMRYIWENVAAVRRKMEKKMMPLVSKCIGNVESNNFLSAFEILHLKVKMYARLLQH